MTKNRPRYDVQRRNKPKLRERPTSRIGSNDIYRKPYSNQVGSILRTIYQPLSLHATSRGISPTFHYRSGMKCCIDWQQLFLQNSKKMKKMKKGSSRCSMRDSFFERIGRLT